MAYNDFMEFIESHIFEKQVNALLSDDEFALFQGFLFSNPKAGAVIQQTGGLRKVRWAVQGQGKSGGVRVIYFNRLSNGEIWLLTIYSKGARDSIPGNVLSKLKESINGKDDREGSPKEGRKAKHRK